MELKIVFTGPPNAGKTTAIAAISDEPPVVTDVTNHDRSLDKLNTTVGMDYGVVKLGEGEVVRLFGTPGQKRFDFMWRILARNAIGIVILLDNSQPQALAQLAEFLSGLAPELGATACVIGVGRMDTHPEPSLDIYQSEAERFGHLVPVLAVDVRQREDVVLLLDLLLAQAEARTFVG